MSTRTEDQNPLLPVKLKPVDMQKGAGSRPFPKPLMVKPNFTVNSLETRFNPPVFSNGPNIVSRRDAVGATLPNREQHENSYAETPSSGAWTPIKPSVLQKHLFHKDISAGPGTTEDLSVPKTKPLPNVFALGKCPAKPERPPHVNLNKFRGNGKTWTSMMKLHSVSCMGSFFLNGWNYVCRQLKYSGVNEILDTCTTV